MVEPQGMNHKDVIDQLTQAIQGAGKRPSEMDTSIVEIEIDTQDERGVRVDLALSS